MKENLEQSLKAMLVHEGGYANHPQDPGGRTNLGVTQRVWEEWKGSPSDEDEMRSLTVEQVTPLYKKRFWDAARCDDLPGGVDYVVFDFAVNAGVGRSAITLQTICGVARDGAIGPITLEAVKQYEPKTLIEKFSDHREFFYKQLSTYPVFGKGWIRRVNEAKELALQMV